MVTTQRKGRDLPASPRYEIWIKASPPGGLVPFRPAFTPPLEGVIGCALAMRGQRRTRPRVPVMAERRLLEAWESGSLPSTV